MKILVHSIDIRATLIDDKSKVSQVEKHFIASDKSLTGDIKSMFRLAESFIFYNVVDKPAEERSNG